jgi:hypothetical protein
MPCFEQPGWPERSQQLPTAAAPPSVWRDLTVRLHVNLIPTIPRLTAGGWLGAARCWRRRANRASPPVCGTPSPLILLRPRARKPLQLQHHLQLPGDDPDVDLWAARVGVPWRGLGAAVAMVRSLRPQCTQLRWGRCTSLAARWITHSSAPGLNLRGLTRRRRAAQPRPRTLCNGCRDRHYRLCGLTIGCVGSEGWSER